MLIYEHVGLGALKNAARGPEKRRTDVRQTMERLPLFTDMVKEENIETMADIIATESDVCITELLERINTKAAVLNDPFMGRFLLIFTVITLRHEIEAFENMLVELTLAEIAQRR